jgi:enoyl-CoA hydratase/carnithine racemase
VTVLTLDAPRKNALSPELVVEMRRAVDAAAAQWPPVLVIQAPSGTFCSGFDLAPLEDENDDHLRNRFRAVQHLLDLLRLAPVITIAVVDGPVVGAGADLALACHFRVTTPRARFRFPGAGFGVLLGTERLLEVVGPARMLEAMTGRWIDASEALSWGLSTHACTDDDDADATVHALVHGFAGIDRTAFAQALSIARSGFGEATALEPSLAAPGVHERVSTHAQRARHSSPAKP